MCNGSVTFSRFSVTIYDGASLRRCSTPVPQGVLGSERSLTRARYGVVTLRDATSDRSRAVRAGRLLHASGMTIRLGATERR